MVSDFALVDLESQIYAVLRYVQGWTRSAFLDWLSQFGEVRRWDHSPNVYFFHSHFGLRASFLLTDDGEFIFIYEHTMHLVASGVFST
jgi:hypothetical protein